MVHSLESAFAAYGSFIGGASTLTLSLLIGSVVFVVGILGGGMALLSPTADSEFLYTPINSQAHKDRAELRRLFPTNASSFGSFTIYRDDRENAWTPEAFRAANALHAFA